MHISDGVLPAQVALTTGAATAALAGVLLCRLDGERIPRVALCTSFFFVASLVHIPFGPTSFHLMLGGLVGIVMGPWAFLPVVFGLVLQAMLGHGGFSALGANALVMGLPAYLAWGVFRLGTRCLPGAAFLWGFAGGWLAVVASLVLLMLALRLAGDDMAGAAWTTFAVQQPLALLEGVVTGFATALILKVEPRMIKEPRRA